MCGFAGIVSKFSHDNSYKQEIRNMLDSIRHRGPDGEGEYVDEKLGVYLGHRRLAIIDPEHGQQPMISADEQLVIVFNGAIYNYLELRRELIGKGHPIRSYSDTEVLVYAYREWGESCVDRLQGMFAFLILDRSSNRLFCARDRIGIKPFYYVFDGKHFIFSSEIKAIIASKIVSPSTNNDALQDYLTFQFCLGDKTLFTNIKKLEPGQCLNITLDNNRISLFKKTYWDVEYEVDEEHDEAWFVDNLAALIEDSVRMHLRSDVSLGAHLSGGLDSSTIVCLASSLLKGEKIKTFTGAFHEGSKFDETEYAKAVSSFAGTEYNEIYIQGSDLPTVLPRLIHMMDEPLAGPGVIPQYYVSQLASKNVKVVLGGQGGDELFVGYARYLVAYLEQCIAAAIFETSKEDSDTATLESIVPSLPLLKTYGPMLQGLWSNGLFESADHRYFKLIDRSVGVKRLYNVDCFNKDYSPFDSFSQIFNRKGVHSLINRMTYFDLKGSLPALLHVEDRTSMAASIESRVPLLDHKIVEFMAKIPPNIKFSNGRMKYIFKEAIRNTVPKNIFERKDKMGFPTPINHWFKGVAKDFVYDTLLSDRARNRGIYNNNQVEEALKNEKEFGRLIWGLLCLELWHQIYIDRL